MQEKTSRDREEIGLVKGVNSGMRRLLPFLLAALLLITACAKGAPPKSPPADEPSPPPADPATPPPAPPPTTETGLQPEPAGGLKALLKSAPGTFQRIAIPAGQAINREGLFFLQVATGAVEGWVFADPTDYPSVGTSDDSRWIIGGRAEKEFLAERKTGTTYAWNVREARLVAVRGDVALFMTGTQFWVARAGLTAFQPTGLAPVPGAQALIAPDGKTAALHAGSKLYLIETESGKVRDLAQLSPPVYSRYGPVAAASDGFLVRSHPEPGTVQTLRYAWSGKLVSDQTTTGPSFPSPDGKLLAWQGNLLGMTGTLTIGTPALEPSLRLRGEAACSLPYQGPYWLSDSSGIMVSTSRGPRLLRTNGALETPKVPEKIQGWGVPVPAPDRPDLFAVDGTIAVDAAGKVIAAAVTHSDGQFYGTGGSHLHPWGETSDEVRFLLRNTGKGVSCDPNIFPPAVEEAPLASITAVEVKVAAGDCVNLRQEFTREAPVVRCLPNGSRLVVAEPPGTNNKGELRKWGNPAGLSMGGEFWWYARTEKGERGWVYLDSDYLTLAAARPGEPAPDLVRNRLEDELSNLRYWYRVALGEIACSPAACSDGPTIQSNIWGLMTWCQAGPSDLRRLPGFDQSRHGALLAPIEKSCQALLEAPKSLGELAESPAWREKIRELLKGLP